MENFGIHIDQLKFVSTEASSVVQSTTDSITGASAGTSVRRKADVLLYGLQECVHEQQAENEYLKSHNRNLRAENSQLLNVNKILSKIVSRLENELRNVRVNSRNEVAQNNGDVQIQEVKEEPMEFLPNPESVQNTATFTPSEVPSVTDDNKDEILVDKEAGKKSKNLQLHNHTTLLTNPKPSKAVASEEGASVGKYSCEVCSKQFTTQRRLSQHKKVHETSWKAYKCQVCTKVFICKAQPNSDDQGNPSKPVCKVCGQVLADDDGKPEEYVRKKIGKSEEYVRKKIGRPEGYVHKKFGNTKTKLRPLLPKK